MSRKLHRNGIDPTEYVVPIDQGGTNGATVDESKVNLNLLTSDKVGIALGAVPLDGNGDIPLSVVPSGISFQTTKIDGPATLSINQIGQYTITDYDQYTTYTVTASSGVAVRADDVVYYKAPATPGTYDLSINSKILSIVVDALFVSKPNITYPSPDYDKSGSGITVKADEFKLEQGFNIETLIPGDPGTNKQFGTSISITPDGSRLAIGAPLRGATKIGGVYVFLNTGGVWSQEALLIPTVTNSNGMFVGVSVAITDAGDRIIAGTQVNSVGGSTNTNSAYVFSRSGTTWTQEAALTPSSGLNDDNFGQSVHISNDGTRAAVGCPYRDSTVQNSGVVYVYLRSGTTWVQETILNPPTNVAGSFLGFYRVKLSPDGSRLFATSHGYTVSGVSACGAVFVYSRSGTAWTLEATLSASDKATNDYFGSEISISTAADRVAIGSRTKTVGSVVNAGKVYIYVRSGTTWTEEANFTATNYTTNDFFGVCCLLDTSGTKLIVPVPARTINGVRQPSILFIYLFNGVSWVLSKTYETDDNTISPFGYYITGTTNGYKIALGSTTTFEKSYVIDMDYHQSTDWQLSTVGDFSSILSQSTTDVVNKVSWQVTDLQLNTDYFVRCRYNGYQNGTSEWSDVRHFRTRSSWLPINESQILTASDKAASDGFGIGVSLNVDGTRMVVGAYNKTVGGVTGAGQVYIYTRSGTTWTLEATLTASDKATNDYFGISVAFDSTSNRLVVGAYAKTVGGVTGAGQVYIYTRSGTTWTLENTLSAADKSTSDQFGVSVAFDSTSNRLVVGAYAKTVGGVTGAGQVYIYTRSGINWVLETTLSAADKATNDLFGVSVALTADASRLAIGAYNKTISGLASAGQVYIYVRSGTTWTLENTLTAADKAASNYFGGSCSFNSDGSLLVIGTFIANAARFYIYNRSNNIYTLQAEIPLSDSAITTNSSSKTYISGDSSLLAVGSSTRDFGGIVDAGGVYIFN